MEIFELRYFLGVAKRENIHRASEALNISPGSLSKAITRLEEELGVKLFKREGRNIKLTDHGAILQKKASEIIHLEESTKTALLGHAGNIKVDISGPEILLAHFGLQMTQKIRKRFQNSTFAYHSSNDLMAMDQVSKGNSHLAIVSVDPSDDLHSVLLGEASFRTFVGRGHPLYSAAQNRKTLPVDEVLAHAFVSPSHPLLGTVGFKQSLDGWRDDKFPRKVDYLASSLKVLEEIVVSGLGIAYLPDYFAKELDIQYLKISGCPYMCVQNIRAVYRNPKELGWINQIF